jgi:putative transcriptional regulator
MAKMIEDLKQGLPKVESCVGVKRPGLKLSLPPQIDVKRIREKLRMTQVEFSNSFGFSIDAVKHWEGRRRTPEASTRAFLIVIAKSPKAVISALHPDQVRKAALTRRRPAGNRSPGKAGAA